MLGEEAQIVRELTMSKLDFFIGFGFGLTVMALSVLMASELKPKPKALFLDPAWREIPMPCNWMEYAKKLTCVGGGAGATEGTASDWEEYEGKDGLFRLYHTESGDRTVFRLYKFTGPYASVIRDWGVDGGCGGNGKAQRVDVHVSPGVHGGS